MNTIESISTSELHPFPDNPFSVADGYEMELLESSIRDFGIITPLVVRPLENDTGYEIVSGHRRWQAAIKAGIEKVPAFVRTMTRDEAIIALVDCNLHREHILPSEKAHAYRMKLEAVKRQGFRSDLTSTQPVSKLLAGEKVGALSNESRETVRRYVRLTNLQKPLLDLVDEGRIALTPAVELSYLKPQEQKNLIDTIESEDATPSLSQAQRMRQFSRMNMLTMDRVFEVMTEEKGNQREMLRIPTASIRKYFPRSATPQQMEQTIIRALDAWCRNKAKHRDEHDR